MNKLHNPVMVNEVIDNLNIKNNSIYLDATFGTGGHTNEILKNISNDSKLISIDKDYMSLKLSKKINDNRFEFINCSFSELYNILYKKKILGKINCILIDLGLSMYQIKNSGKGFSFMKDEKIDMRINDSYGISAYSWLKKASINNITYVLKNFGEEKYAKKIATEIIKRRNKNIFFNSTKDLANIISYIKRNKRTRIHPATKSFQAIRIYINNEFYELNNILNNINNFLSKNGILLIISFNSLEGRIIKNKFKNIENDFLKKIPFNNNEYNIFNKKFNNIKMIKKIKPSKEEINNNISSRSAILRIFKKI
ncbi:ribosomal RNA small subunit methyltransferase H [endosymbiont of Sipalinus gigas]|uniref:16S rRNA (cytosine(1402)-N(4))-methyltransferase RsmH n=1 Tax=endosymbiont of Sipalinus gigas TaxID=1972134 RepID=UPI000DC70B96|nr:16S rRNA (cytosine(1402)-N(4))-methyltransferase RsmH [endosymbiont of Sipalinus gigas]BBA85170.1 ribosomal RNA small subunit methyltransferase H [endosymbiont of Sipalinus gigas]